VVSHKFKLPKLAKPGFWKIQVKAGEQIQEQPIRVEAYFPPQFEVHVLLPMYIVDSEEEIKATITAKSELQRTVTGNASLALYGRNFRNNDTFILIWQDKVFLVRSSSLVKTSGSHELVLPMETVRSLMNTIAGVELRLEAEVSEFLYGETVSGYSHTRIIDSSINIHFLGTAPKIFKPGMPFEG
ncbi:unnamed protein product, partial [Timema podura]|nr:unnamed protein product [Timema podura]